MIRARSLSCLLLPALVLSGCAGFGRLRESRPGVTFKHAALREIALDGVVLETTFLVENPGPVALTLESLVYELALEARPVLIGRPLDGLEIPAGGSTDVRLASRVQFAETADALAAALAKKSLAWTAKGSLGFKTPVGTLTLPLEAQGKFDLPKLPVVSIDTPRVDAMSVFGARLMVPIKIENPNAFPLPAPRLKVDLFVGGVEIGTARRDGEAVIDPEAEQKLELFLDLKFQEVGVGVARAISSGESQLKVDGALEIGGATVPVSIEKTTKFPRAERKATPGWF